MMRDQFIEEVCVCCGTLFEEEDEYIYHLQDKKDKSDYEKELIRKYWINYYEDSIRWRYERKKELEQQIKRIDEEIIKYQKRLSRHLK